ncbi:RxLR-like protein [Plasmopara halstedii]|uniref:RxLR-like protein n=1 Tax=Plasmopara halstedii TaxID=4781 RepID=A0A0P1B583_PLAHL|nr:RxLR-like protein [Plasmopara halstedii]CEG49577.1 RxLR-like protein [Plasmopara halstedii]|eukprot:XP_024585946.1 RxLR-like protein [Plasmopara halstedii]
MQSRLATARLALAVAIVTSGNIADVNARPMHADIIPKYHRYLKEKEHVNTELDIWLEQYGPMGKKNGFIPVTESRSLDDVREDQLQRFYMTKEQINEARTANPMAEFTTDGPLTLMTMDEFKEFLLNSHVSDNNEGADSKKKRRKAAFGRVRNSTLSEGENLESNTSNTKSRSSSNDDESKAWDPAPGESKGDTTTRRLHASESSQYSYSWSGYNTNGQQGQQNDVDTQVQTQRNVQTNTGNDDRETNQGLNFHDISTGDSAQIGAVSSADSGNWNWWGANGWGLYGLGGNSLWWSGPSWWSDIKKPGDAQSNQPYHNQWSSWFYNQPTYPSTADTSLAAESLQAPTNPDTTDDATNVPLTRQKEDVKSIFPKCTSVPLISYGAVSSHKFVLVVNG